MNLLNGPTDLYARALTAFQQKEWRRAYDLSVNLLQQRPNQAEACYLAGLAAVELQQWPMALKHLRQATQIDPKCADYAAQLAKILSLANATGDALREASRALGLSPRDSSTLDTLGVVYTRANAHERAASLFRRAATRSPDNPVFRFNFAMSLMYAGDTEAAEAQLEASLSLDPRYWRAHSSLTMLRRQTQESNHVERLLSLSQQTVGDATAQMYLNMALGKEYEDQDDFTKAFEHFTKGKAALKGNQPSSIKRDEALFEAMTRAFPEQQPQSTGYPTEEPIFVVGMPRSGTTLVERIISSHSYVYSAGELQNFGLALKQASGVRTPSLLDLETIAKSRNLPWDRLGEKYLFSTRPLTDGKPHFIDKFPHNFLYIGFIANALPKAKIICLRRNPMDTCLSNFRELFTAGSEFHGYSLDVLDAGRYYILFDRLMEHWKRVFPGRILEVEYETLVDTQEASTRQLLEYCDLPWSDACLRFEQNGAPVTTASSVQVRAPIYRSSIRRWKKYEPQLTELRDLLTNAGIDCDR